MNRRLEKKLGAYRDGALSEAAEEQVQRVLARDADAARVVERGAALSSLVREAWAEGPAAPSPEYLIASLRPEMSAIDREFEGSGVWQRSLNAIRESVQAVPGLALAGACALLMLYFIPSEPGPMLGEVKAATTMTEFQTDTPVLPIYDLAGEHPLLILEGEDGSTIIWILDESEKVSFRALRSEDLV